MSRHVMECLGKTRVVVEDGKITEIGEPQIEVCPLSENTEASKDSMKSL